IKADITGKPFVVARQADGSEGGHTLGLFAMTAQAAGLCQVEELPEFVERLLPMRSIYEPNPARHAMYQELFSLYKGLSDKLRPDFSALAQVAGRFGLE
ncbi:MAG TPA: hypothetical protein VF806_03085, partial [Anaerolineaceae bacterium]